MRFLNSFLISLTSCCLWQTSIALSCHYLVVDIYNYTDYTWTLSSNSACDGEDPAGPECSTKNLHSPGSWEDIATIPPQTKDSPGSIEFQLKDSDSSGPNLTFEYSNNVIDHYQQDLTFKIRASKVECTASCGGGKQSNNSTVSNGLSFINISKATESKEPGGIACSGGHKAYTTFNIYYPVSPRISITLPSKQDKILSNSILQDSFNLLDPNIMIVFDTYLHNPAKIESNTLTFYEPCDSDACWHAYCKTNHDSKGCVGYNS